MSNTKYSGGERHISPSTATGKSLRGRTSISENSDLSDLDFSKLRFDNQLLESGPSTFESCNNINSGEQEVFEIISDALIKSKESSESTRGEGTDVADLPLILLDIAKFDKQFIDAHRSCNSNDDQAISVEQLYGETMMEDKFSSE